MAIELKFLLALDAFAKLAAPDSVRAGNHL